LAIFLPISKVIWLSVSEAEWTASLSSETERLMMAMTNFTAAIQMFAPKAA
jgi:hypothetical protein